MLIKNMTYISIICALTVLLHSNIHQFKNKERMLKVTP